MKNEVPYYKNNTETESYSDNEEEDIESLDEEFSYEIDLKNDRYPYAIV